MPTCSIQGMWKEAFTGWSKRPVLKNAVSIRSGTRLFEKGVNAKIVSELLGHSKVSHTLDIYTHCTQSVKSEAVKVPDICAL